MTRILEIGPGDFPAPFATDMLDWPTFDWGVTAIPFPHATFDEVYASHVLEHVPWFRTVEALRDANNVIVPGGMIEIWVPDFEYIIACYQQKKCGDRWRKHNPNDDYMAWVNGRIFTYGPEPNWHRAVFDADHLKSCLEQSGFVDIRFANRRTRHDHGPMEVGMKGRKP